MIWSSGSSVTKIDLYERLKKFNAEMHKLLAIDLVTSNLNWILDFANLVISQFAKACTEGCIRWKEQYKWFSFHKKIKICGVCPEQAAGGNNELDCFEALNGW